MTDIIQPKMEFTHEMAGIEAVQVLQAQDPFIGGSVLISHQTNLSGTLQWGSNVDYCSQHSRSALAETS